MISVTASGRIRVRARVWVSVRVMESVSARVKAFPLLFPSCAPCGCIVYWSLGASIGICVLDLSCEFLGQTRDNMQTVFIALCTIIFSVYCH